MSRNPVSEALDQRTDWSRFIELTDQASGEGDHGIVLTWATHLNVLLRKLIATRLDPDADVSNDIFNTNRTLGRFKAKIEMARALGLIDEAAYDDLLTVNTIRGRFARHVELSLDSERVLRHVRKLTLTPDLSRLRDASDRTYDAHAARRLGELEKDAASPRVRFTLAYLQLAHDLTHGGTGDPAGEERGEVEERAAEPRGRVELPRVEADHRPEEVE
jgi:hypothetical protein